MPLAVYGNEFTQKRITFAFNGHGRFSVYLNYVLRNTEEDVKNNSKKYSWGEEHEKESELKNVCEFF